MDKVIVWTVFLASSCLLAESPESLNKQETVAPKVESPTPARVKKASKTKALTVQVPDATPQVKEEVVVAEKPISAQEALVVEVLKEPTSQPSKVETIKTPVTAQVSSVEEAPVSQVEAPESLNKQETVAPKVESPRPSRVKKASKTKALTVQVPDATPQVKEEVVAAEKPVSAQEALVVEALKEPTSQPSKVETIKTPVTAQVSMVMEEPAKEEASTLQAVHSEAEVSETTPVTAQVSSVEAAPVLQVEATEPAMVEPAQKTMGNSESQSASMNTKKEEKLGSSRFANIAIGAASAAVVIVAAILGSN